MILNFVQKNQYHHSIRISLPDWDAGDPMEWGGIHREFSPGPGLSSHTRILEAASAWIEDSSAHLSTIQKNPRAHKNKIGTSPPPPQNTKYPPPP